MTDSVTKNLEVENCVAEKLGSNHIPHHLFYKAHVVEKFDETNLKVLSNIKIQLQLHERLECLNPSLKPFFWGKKAIVLAHITAITKLITQEKSGNTVIRLQFEELKSLTECWNKRGSPNVFLFTKKDDSQN